MSRSAARGTGTWLADWWVAGAGRFAQRWHDLRTSRFGLQAALSLGLVVTAGLLSLWSPQPLTRAKQALTWTVQSDYDFTGQAERVHAWALGEGGWLAAARGAWAAGSDRVKGWTAHFAKATPGSTGGTAVGTAPVQSTGRAPVIPVNGAVLHAFGWLPKSAGNRLHEGIDLLATVGTPVVAALNGTILRTYQDAQLGGVVEVDHGSVRAVYAQVDGIAVRGGQRVRRGETLARVAAPRGAERQFQPHLHFEVRTPDKGIGVDPAFFLGLGGNNL